MKPGSMPTLYNAIIAEVEWCDYHMSPPPYGERSDYCLEGGRQDRYSQLGPRPPCTFRTLLLVEP